MDIYGHTPIPLAQNTFSHLGSSSTNFQVLNFQGHFEVLNDMFLDLFGPRGFQWHSLAPNGIFTRWLQLSNKVSNAPNIDHMQKLRPQEVGVSTTPIGADKPFGVHLLGLGCLRFSCQYFMLKIHFEPHGNEIFQRMSIAVTYLLKDKMPPF
jgi:hypothetical protein